MKSNYLLMLILILALSACKKDESPKLWTISGEVRMQDALNPAITTPLVGINVYLLNAPFTMDSITHWYTKTDILDSTQTNADGTYNFSQLIPGNYSVIATDTIAGYRFDWSASPDPNNINAVNAKQVNTINFTTPEPIIENSEDSFTFKFNNFNYSSHFDDGCCYGKHIVISRTKRGWDYLGWGAWGPIFGWGNWNWVGCGSTLYIWDPFTVIFGTDDNIYNAWKNVSFSKTRDASSYMQQYKDEFLIEFYVGAINGIIYPVFDFEELKYSLTLSGDDLKSTNEFNIDWKDDNPVITRIN